MTQPPNPSAVAAEDLRLLVAVAAARASDPPPLDDFIEARQIVGHAEDKYIAYMKEHINRPVQRLPMRAFEFFRDEIAAALAEREREHDFTKGLLRETQAALERAAISTDEVRRVERERAAKIAESFNNGWGEAIAAAIRNQTLT